MDIVFFRLKLIYNMFFLSNKYKYGIMTCSTFFKETFNKENFSSFFKRKLLTKKGGGRDGFSPKVFWEKNKDNIGDIVQQCIDGKYKFSFYNEVLYLKGRDKYPRVISVPSVRDRIVLGVLNEYLERVFPECVNHHIPNFYIKRIKEYIENTSDESIKFLKTDFSSFYNSINQKCLLEKLGKRIPDGIVVELIKQAIQTPTVSEKCSSKIKNSEGVPQGLAISNILASIYMYDFDSVFLFKDNGLSSLAFRYVDDMIFLQPKDKDLIAVLEHYICNNDLNLKFSSEKVKKGILGINDLDFLGYVFTSQNKVTPREKRVNLFINRLARRCTQFKREYANKYQRPHFLDTDEKFISYFIEDINWLISGVKIESHLFGWLAYYQQITDISLLYRLDKILQKKLLKGIELPQFSQLHSFVDSFFDITEHGGTHYVCDFDKMNTIAAKKVYLTRRGWLNVHLNYTDEQIEYLFNQNREHVRKNMEQHIGYYN